MNISRLERYQDIIDDWPAFVEALSRPLPTCIWVNPLRTSPRRIVKQFEKSDMEYEALSWCEDAFRLPTTSRPGHRIEYIAGQFHVQEEASMLPVHLLAPEHGERILDLCAAPGNKTAQISVRMANTGTVIANDRDYRRMKAVRRVIDRLGLFNVSLTTYDGANYPQESGLFDRVLADVPCSCEGTSRKNPEVLYSRNARSLTHIASVQKAILRRAVQLCKPGGIVVYSTCTYSPEENEMVIQSILEQSCQSEDIRIELLPARVAGFRSMPGLTSWQSHTFDSSMSRAMRVYPHLNDSGGFFIALLKKLPASDNSN